MTEENDQKTEVYRFGDCILDADRRELTRAGEPVTTQPKAFELLLYLVRNRSRAVDKDEQCSDWAARPLRESQLEYAALDALACVRLEQSHAHAPCDSVSRD